MTECAGTKKADTIRSEGQSDVSGKGGNDTIVDTGGASVILGGPGNNLIEGGSGHDTIKARNGEADGIDCGKGTDTVTFDAGLDEVANCEMRRS